jgi:hypothetical protein
VSVGAIVPEFSGTSVGASDPGKGFSEPRIEEP